MNYAHIDQQARIYADSTVGVSNTNRYRLANAVSVPKSNYHPNSSTPELRNIDDELGNTEKAGQWVYRTDVITDATTEPTTPGGQNSMCTCITLSNVLYSCSTLYIGHPLQCSGIQYL